MSIEQQVRVYEPLVHSDDRGSLYESYSEQVFDAWVGREVRFVQDNHSTSTKGVLRGLHYQLPPAAQEKLVRVTRGAIFDVAVDIRRSSPTFGEWFGVELSEQNRRQLWIPEGFAHGFLALGDVVEVQYKASSPYTPRLDRAVLWNDPEIGIVWPFGQYQPLVSAKDAAAPTLAEAEVFD